MVRRLTGVLQVGVVGPFAVLCHRRCMSCCHLRCWSCGLLLTCSFCFLLLVLLVPFLPGLLRVHTCYEQVLGWLRHFSGWPLAGMSLLPRPLSMVLLSGSVAVQLAVDQG